MGRPKKVESAIVDTAMDKINENRTEQSKQEEMKPSLFEFRKEMAEIEAMAAETGEITDEQAAALVKLHAGSIDKMKCLAWIVARVQNAVDLVDEEIKRLQELKKYRKGFSARLEKALVDHILAVEPDKKRIDLDTVILKAHKCPPSVVLEPDFQDVIYSRIVAITGKDGQPIHAETLDAARANGDFIDYQPDKTAIKEAILAGETVEGASVINDKYTLKIQ